MAEDGPPMPWEHQPWLASVGGSSRDWVWGGSGRFPTYVPLGLPRVAPPILAVVPSGPRAKIPDVVLEPSGPPPIIGAQLPNVQTGPLDRAEENDMAIDWGAAVSTGIGLLNQYGQMTSGQLASSFKAGIPSQTPSILAPTPGQMGDNGHWVPAGRCRRRRGRAMLTPTNMSLLFQIGTLPNNANVRIALAKSIRKG